MKFSSPGERRAWILAAMWLLAIYSSLYFVQFVLDWLREGNLLRLTLAGVFSSIALGLATWLLRRRPGRRELLTASVFAAVYVVLLFRTSIVQEQVHYVEYGVLGGVFYRALQERWSAGVRAPTPGAYSLRRFAPALMAILLTGFCGWIDEVIQGLLPNRTYDSRDVRLNLAAGALSISAIACRTWARSLDAQARGGTDG